MVLVIYDEHSTKCSAAMVNIEIVQITGARSLSPEGDNSEEHPSL